MFKSNVRLKPYSPVSGWRNMALVSWKEQGDPQVYGRMEVDMENALAYAEELKASGQGSVSPTHLVVRAVALALQHHPRANAIIRLARIYQRESVDIFCQVGIDGEEPDLSGVLIREADRKSPAQIAAELGQRAVAMKARGSANGEDRSFEFSRKILAALPSPLLRLAMAATDFFMYTLNRDLSFLGLPRDPFGSVMVSAIGSLGISEGWPPLVPFSRVPILVSAGAVEPRAVVRDGQVVARRVMTLGVVFDHRLMDGITVSRLARFAKEYLEDPSRHEAAQA